MTYYKNVNNELVPFSEEETTARKAEEDAWAAAAPTRAFEKLREERDKKLNACDWMACSDLTLADQWKLYRQALRDLTAQYNDDTLVGTITWPTEPS